MDLFNVEKCVGLCYMKMCTWHITDIIFPVKYNVTLYLNVLFNFIAKTCNKNEVLPFFSFLSGSLVG